MELFLDTVKQGSSENQILATVPYLLIKQCCNAGATEEAWNHFQVVLKLERELAELKSDIVLLDNDIKVHLGIKLLQAG